ncbi:MAG: ABC transporter ATP-binding protein [Pirellulaceae bacterium]|nr:ABC transporter ATP-binding protein [Pirellulaceae bacterium]
MASESPVSEMEVIPVDLAIRVCRQLAPDEQVVGWFQTNLTPSLQFADGLIFLTKQRLISFESEALSDSMSHVESIGEWRSWPISDIAELRLRDRAGLASIEIVGHDRLLHVWRFSSVRISQARRLLLEFERIKKLGSTDVVTTVAVSICPSCGMVMQPGESVCSECAPSAAPDTTRSLWRLTRFARPRLPIIVFGFALTLLSTAIGLVPPLLTLPLIDEVLVPRKHFEWVPWYIAGLFLTVVVAWLLSWAKTFVMATVSEQISFDLRNRIFEHLQQLSLEFFGGRRTGDLISRVSSDTERICDFLSINLVDFATDLLLIIMTAAILIWIDPMMAAITLIPFPIIGWLIQFFRNRMRQGFARGSAAWAEMVNVLADTIPGIRVVKAFAQEYREVDRFTARNAQVLYTNTRVNRLWAAFGPIISLTTEIGLLVIWAFGAYRIYHDQITFGVLQTFIFYIGRLYIRLDSMSRMLANAQRAAAATHRIFEILDRVPSVAEPIKPIQPGRLQGGIEFSNVCFRYGARQVITDVNLSIRPGEMIGVVGPSGAGKSTLVNLVCRFFDVASGSIRVDGHDIRSFPISAFRSNIGIVLQEPFLFFGSIGENIAYGRPDAKRAEIVAAARASKAHDFILRLPDGYDSIVGERGQSLSGGERQRISIARALLTDPRILILDEATSSVDTETEREIQGALDYLVQGRTTIAIAHRISTLRKADRIVVLEKGTITEIGNHEQLLELGGTYARLNRVQEQMQKEITIQEVIP